MLQWFVQYGTAVQAITPIISLILTVGAIAVTWWYVALTAEIAETTHRQLSAVLQPMITIEAKSTSYGKLEGTNLKMTYYVRGRFWITNIGTSPVKIKTLHAIFEHWTKGKMQTHVDKIEA